MAEITVILPGWMDKPEAFTRSMLEFVRPGLDSEMEQIVQDITADPAFPTNTRALRDSIKAMPGRIAGSNALLTGVHSVGAGSVYSDVQDRGRRAGARSPPAAAIRRWVELARKDDVITLAKALQADYKKRHPKKRGGRKGPSRGIGKYQRRAVFLLTRAVMRKLKRRGMAGKGFVSGRLGTIESNVAAAVTREMRLFVRRHNQKGAE